MNKRTFAVVALALALAVGIAEASRLTDGADVTGGDGIGVRPVPVYSSDGTHRPTFEVDPSERARLDGAAG